MRWIIAALTSVAVIALIYHHGVPRTQPWHRVLPGAALATVLWFVSTVLFGFYLRRFGNYDVIYGSVGTAIALLIWLYLVSMVVLIGAEFNALRFPRYLFGRTPRSMLSPGERRRRNSHGFNQELQVRRTRCTLPQLPAGARRSSAPSARPAIRKTRCAS